VKIEVNGVNAPDHQQDPWTKVESLHGFAADELISTLQKSIRRGLLENAALTAYEMFATSEELENKAWQRLAVIAVEDVGFGHPTAPLLIHALDDFRRRIDRGVGDRLLFLMHAVRVLATTEKDRTTDELATWVRQAVADGTASPDVFDDALDMHTRRGQEMGRDFTHFFLHGARVANELPGRDLTYRERLLARLTPRRSGS
jgi:replication-associated recombination protein RarA